MPTLHSSTTLTHDVLNQLFIVGIKDMSTVFAKLFNVTKLVVEERSGNNTPLEVLPIIAEQTPTHRILPHSQ